MFKIFNKYFKTNEDSEEDFSEKDKIIEEKQNPMDQLMVLKSDKKKVDNKIKKLEDKIESNNLKVSEAYENHQQNIKKNDVVDMSVLEYLNLPISYHGRAGPLLGYRVPIDYPEKEVELDPYMLGYWLGDGNSRTSAISTQDSTIIHYFVKNLPDNLYLKYVSQYDYRINSINRVNTFLNFLRNNNLILNKHIPHNYKCNTREIRLKILAGIL